MKVIIELDEKYDEVLTVTAIGSTGFTTWVSTQSVELAKHNHLVLGSDGKWTNEFRDCGERKDND